MQQTKACIILAGGKGTRLQSVVSDRPKCLAEINGVPFLEYQLNYLYQQGIEHIIFSVGYMREHIYDFFNDSERVELFDHQFVVEESPLGTGGAIVKALHACTFEEVFVINGDTYCDVNLKDMSVSPQKGNAVQIAVQPVTQVDRYGKVTFDAQHKITEFGEKQPIAKGFINAGIYKIHRQTLLSVTHQLPEVFSFEKDYLEQAAQFHHYISAHVPQNDKQYFIDIGIPEDYQRAQTELPPFLVHYE